MSHSFSSPWQCSELCGCFSELCCGSSDTFGGEKFWGVSLVNGFPIAGACGAFRSHRKDKCVRIWTQKSSLFICIVFLSLSGAANDHWATGLWGRGVSEKSPDPQWPPSRPAALPCRRCLGESPHASWACPVGHTAFIISMKSWLCSEILPPNSNFWGGKVLTLPIFLSVYHLGHLAQWIFDWDMRLKNMFLKLHFAL